MNIINRRDFVRSLSAALGGTLLPAGTFGSTGKPLLKLGVVSDVHVGSDRCFSVEEDLSRVFRHFDRARVDGVVIPGDIAHTGLISEMERFAAIWHRAFPDDRRSDGGRVEKLFATGNHCIDGWHGRWNRFSTERLRKERFNYESNPQKTWDRLFHEEFKPIFEKRINGITFVGAQWMSLEEPFIKPPIEDFFAAKRGKLDPELPFFYIQHAPPDGTCHGARGSSGGAEARRALDTFPNAVALTGHTHDSIADSRTVWQGDFTSIGCGCLIEAGAPLDFANVRYHWYKPSRDRIMERTRWIDYGGNAMTIDVYGDHLTLHRFTARDDEPIAEDWEVPLPAAYGRGFDFKVRQNLTVAPQFAAGTEATVAYFPKGHPEAHKDFARTPCYAVTFPAAQTSKGIVFDYKIEILQNKKVVRRDRIIANGYGLAKARMTIPGLLLIKASDLPASSRLVARVTAGECFGKYGEPIFSQPFDTTAS